MPEQMTLRQAAEMALEFCETISKLDGPHPSLARTGMVIDAIKVCKELRQALTEGVVQETKLYDDGVNKPDYRDKDIADLTKACQVLLRENLRLQEELNK